MKSYIKRGAFAAILLAAASLAMATQPTQNPCGNSGNNCNTGGPGGQGGSATGVGVGIGIAGAAASATANSTNVNANSNSNRNTNANVQGQQQGQSQSSTSAVNHSGNSASVSGSYSGGNTQSNAGNNTRTDVTVGGDTVTYAAQERAPVATAYAAPLTASNGTCMGSSSAGAQGIGLGLSFGTTWTDNSCDLRYDAEALRAAGLPAAAQARLCQKPEIAKAMEAAGTPCPGAKKAASAGTVSPVASAPVAQPQYTDPIVRARLGLPPLK